MVRVLLPLILHVTKEAGWSWDGWVCRCSMVWLASIGCSCLQKRETGAGLVVVWSQGGGATGFLLLGIGSNHECGTKSEIMVGFSYLLCSSVEEELPCKNQSCNNPKLGERRWRCTHSMDFIHAGLGLCATGFGLFMG